MLPLTLIRCLRLSSPTIKKINPDTTIGINDSVTFNVSAEDSSGGITQIAWDFDGNGKYDWTSPTLQASGYRYQTTGLYKAVLRLTNECQKQTYDTVSMAVVQDVPIIRFLSDDTIVDHGGSVRCSVFVQQQFGTMTIEIDTSNNGSYKALGNLGLSGSKKYLFSTGNACTWDSVKVRVTDNGMNVVTKGFRVRCVFRSIRHPIPALFGSLIRSEATHWFKYTKGAGSGGSFPHRFSFQFDFIPVMKQSVANGIS